MTQCQGCDGHECEDKCQYPNVGLGWVRTQFHEAFAMTNTRTVQETVMPEKIPKIDLAWEAVSALGGRSDQDNSYDQGFVDAIGKALEAIEKLGGKDPQPARVAERRKHNAKHPLPVMFEGVSRS